MKLTKKVELGIKAVNFLKSRSAPTRTADMASEVGTTPNFLEQVMRQLRLAGVVSVKRGPGGGYFLDASKVVTAYDVARAVGKFEQTLDMGDTSPSNLLRQSIVSAFRNTTI